MTPLRNIQGTRNIKGYFFYVNLRPNQQLDVLGYKGFSQNLLKTCIFRTFSCHLQNWMKNFTLSRLFFTFIWPLNVIKTLFTNLNHQIKSISSINCNITLIQFVFSRGDSALWYILWPLKMAQPNILKIASNQCISSKDWWKVWIVGRGHTKTKCLRQWGVL